MSLWHKIAGVATPQSGPVWREELEAAVNKVEGEDSLSVTSMTLQFLDKENSTQNLRLDWNSIDLFLLTSLLQGISVPTTPSA